jgi:hypothetical protein
MSVGCPCDRPPPHDRRAARARLTARTHHRASVDAIGASALLGLFVFGVSMRHYLALARSFRSVGDVTRALTASGLELRLRHALITYVQGVGPGSWTRVRRLVVTPEGATMESLWRQIAPHRSRHATPADYVKQMSRGRPLAARITARAERPEMPRDAWDLLALVLVSQPPVEPAEPTEPTALA